ncbi:MAG: hypothetical protein ABJD68_04305 [Nakamurella sp.]
MSAEIDRYSENDPDASNLGLDRLTVPVQTRVLPLDLGESRYSSIPATTSAEERSPRGPISRAFQRAVRLEGLMEGLAPVLGTFGISVSVLGPDRSGPPSCATPAAAPLRSPATTRMPRY